MGGGQSVERKCAAACAANARAQIIGATAAGTHHYPQKPIKQEPLRLAMPASVAGGKSADAQTRESPTARVDLKRSIERSDRSVEEVAVVVRVPAHPRSNGKSLAARPSVTLLSRRGSQARPHGSGGAREGSVISCSISRSASPRLIAAQASRAISTLCLDTGLASPLAAPHGEMPQSKGKAAG
jgi:hypothetical protein